MITPKTSYYVVFRMLQFLALQQVLYAKEERTSKLMLVARHLMNI